MKIISWNVNGIRSILSKGTIMRDFINVESPDIVCLQEIRCGQSFDFASAFPDYEYRFINTATKPGYSGTCILSKIKPKKVTYGDDDEGRLIIAEYAKFVLMCMYVPNSKPDLSRLEYRCKTWEPTIRANVKEQKNPVILCGDFNVAPNEIDLHNPKQSKGKHGFTSEERGEFAALLSECTMIDVFREMHPSKVAYTWFSNFAKSRERNKGWRIDHFVVSQKIFSRVLQVDILGNVKGSDHVPISVIINNL